MSSGRARWSVARSVGKRWSFFYPGGQGFAGDPENPSNPAHTGAFLIGPQDFLLAFRTIGLFRTQDLGRPAVFAAILLTARAISAIFDNVVTATCAARLLR